MVDAARARIQELDAEILHLAAERIRLARDIGRSKAAAGLPTVDYAQERRVLDRARVLAEAEGLDPEVAQQMVDRLIEAAVTVQEDERLRIGGGGAGKSAVVVGGAGRMGRWLGRFLAVQGYEIYVLDPAEPDELAAAQGALADADLILVSAPPRAISALYQSWMTAPPRGVVCDVASIKAPVLSAMRELQSAGGHVASIHPMFGPAARVLRGVDVVVCDTGDEAATNVAESLFLATAARVIRVPAEEHDQWMADVLALSHATALAFAAALPADGLAVRSTTLGALSDLAWDVVHESPEVYFEIQSENPSAGGSRARLADAVGRLQQLIDTKDAAGFAAYMQDGKQRLTRQRALEADP